MAEISDMAYIILLASALVFNAGDGSDDASVFAAITSIAVVAAMTAYLIHGTLYELIYFHQERLVKSYRFFLWLSQFSFFQQLFNTERSYQKDFERMLETNQGRPVSFARESGEFAKLALAVDALRFPLWRGQSFVRPQQKTLSRRRLSPWVPSTSTSNSPRTLVPKFNCFPLPSPLLSSSLSHTYTSFHFKSLDCEHKLRAKTRPRLVEVGMEELIETLLSDWMI